MKADYATPEKDLIYVIKQTPQTAQRTQPEGIFSSEHKQSRSRISQRRYTNIRDSQILDEATVDSLQNPNQTDLKSGKLLNYTEDTIPQPPPTHNRRHSHKRSSSICVPIGVSNEQVFHEISQQVKKANHPSDEDKKVLVKNQSPVSTGSHHIRNLSDADSVIYLGNNEEATNEKENHFVDSLDQPDLKANLHRKALTAATTCTKTNQSDNEKCESQVFDEGKFQYESYIRGSLPIFGNMPCTAYCHFCREVVHTKLDFNAKVPVPLLKVLSTISACCRVPE